MSGGGGGGQNTVQQVQQVPDYVQAESQANQQLANNLSSSPYPVYQGQLIQPWTDMQNQGAAMAVNSAQNYQPYMNSATTWAEQVNPVGASQPYINQGMAQVSAADGNFAAGGNNVNAGGAVLQGAAPAGQWAQALTNPNAVSGYMSPYIQASLAPQLSDLALQNSAQQKQINAQAAQAGAYGDARQGVQSALNNFYTDQAVNQVTGQAYQNAFGAANQALGQAQNTQLGAGQLYNQTGAQYANLANAYGSLGQGYNQGAGISNQLANTGLQQQAAVGNNAQLYAGLGSLNQQLGLNAANAVYASGALQQQQQQNQLNSAYQQYLNQVNWPYQMLNVRESAISNNPYNIQTATTLPSANSAAQGFGAATSLAGLANNLTSKSA